jgi:GNAT superfamily N-acetyltransferase
MDYIQAAREHLDAIFKLTQDTIRAVYPNYYPSSVVDFFCAHHSKEAIQADIDSGNVRILFEGDMLVGTGSHNDNHITRVFVAPTFQARGYGSYIMQQLETEIGKEYHEALLDASLPAARWYEKRGYLTIKHENLAVENGAVLTFEVMKKDLPNVTTAINYDGKHFVVKGNSINGEVSAKTVFAYHQSGDTLWAEYYGGGLIKGFLIGTVAADGVLDFHYQHINAQKRVRIGRCHSVPHITEGGKLELHEQWQWLDGGKEIGSSILVEQ